MINVNDIKNGMTILFEDNIYTVLEFSHVKPGKGAAFVQAKLKNLRTGSIVEKRFNSGVKLEKAMVEKKNMQSQSCVGNVASNLEIFVNAVENAELRDVKFVKRLANVEAVNLSDLPKIKTGVRSLDRICGGLLRGHVVLLSGKRGEGKSTFMSSLVAEAIEQDNSVFVYSGELPNYHFKN